MMYDGAKMAPMSVKQYAGMASVSTTELLRCTARAVLWIEVTAVQSITMMRDVREKYADHSRG